MNSSKSLCSERAEGVSIATSPDGDSGWTPHSAENPSIVNELERVLVVVPVFNDWCACSRMLRNLDRVLADHRLTAAVLIVDDGSTIPCTAEVFGFPRCSLTRIAVLRLRRNLGHQRAIGIGLSYVEAKLNCLMTLVMDGDGEDDPHDVPLLLEACEKERMEKIIFAERVLRSESFTFRCFYVLYKVLYRLMTGKIVRVGNYSVIPRHSLRCLVAMSELWIHYAASVLSSRLLYSTVKTARAPRVAGKSKMNFVGLVIHGLSAISVHAEVVGVRLLIATTTLVLLTLLGILTVVGVNLYNDSSIPGWSMITSGLLLVVMLQAIMFAISFSFTILSGRRGAGFIPSRDYSYFMDYMKVVVTDELKKGKND
jgi:hypothetical protein